MADIRCIKQESLKDNEDKTLSIAISVPLALISVTISVVAIVLGSCWCYHKMYRKGGPGQSVNHTDSEEGKAVVLSDTLLQATKKGKLTIILETDKVQCMFIASNDLGFEHLLMLKWYSCTYCIIVYVLFAARKK